jgi:hypothetical protein
MTAHEYRIFKGDVLVMVCAALACGISLDQSKLAHVDTALFVLIIALKVGAVLRRVRA